MRCRRVCRSRMGRRRRGMRRRRRGMGRRRHGMRRCWMRRRRMRYCSLVSSLLLWLRCDRLGWSGARLMCLSYLCRLCRSAGLRLFWRLLFRLLLLRLGLARLLSGWFGGRLVFGRFWLGRVGMFASTLMNCRCRRFRLWRLGLLRLFLLFLQCLVALSGITCRFLTFAARRLAGVNSWLLRFRGCLPRFVFIWTRGERLSRLTGLPGFNLSRGCRTGRFSRFTRLLSRLDPCCRRAGRLTGLAGLARLDSRCGWPGRFSGFSGLIRLARLDSRGCWARRFSGFSGLIRLARLDSRGCRTRRFSGFSGLIRLTRLDSRCGWPGGLPGLSGLTRLSRVLRRDKLRFRRRVFWGRVCRGRRRQCHLFSQSFLLSGRNILPSVLDLCAG
jgi:hypothetical protein